MNLKIRNTKLSDYENIVKICKSIYPDSQPWNLQQITSHLELYPEGQFVVESEDDKKIVAMSASLVIRWDDYEFNSNWKVFTDSGKFTNHNPTTGRTLYGAEVMVHPDYQGQGIGKLIYKAREDLVKKQKLLRIRAGARLRGYAIHAQNLSPDEYVIEVIKGKLFDATLTFQLKRGFNVLGVVSDYLLNDPESLGYAAVIEWLNPEIAKPEDFELGEKKYRIKGPWSK